uniref:Uncharacterized protein n=1 Tax=Hanusia phi TaxID=3032 RepID=A0A7S0HK16_9CRYP|mmetsp:Transcript_25007/g.56435  ORF Transcript_25007/g.56435 Transcript_25007/m.56435 type:complete len:159 (+) Transcript_25007:314-790(+)
MLRGAIAEVADEVVTTVGTETGEVAIVMAMAMAMATAEGVEEEMTTTVAVEEEVGKIVKETGKDMEEGVDMAAEMAVVDMVTVAMEAATAVEEGDMMVAAVVTTAVVAVTTVVVAATTAVVAAEDMVVTVKAVTTRVDMTILAAMADRGRIGEITMQK